MSETTWMEGRISVEAAIRGQNRVVEALYLQESGKRDRGRLAVQRLAERSGVPVHHVDEAFFALHAGGRTHGGILAEVGPRRLQTLEALVAGRNEPFIVMLDGFEDPFNFGQAVRASYAAGVDGLVVRPRSWLSATAVVTRSSAGATEWIPTAAAETALHAAEFYREQGLVVACTARQSATSLYEADLTKGTFLLIGGEKRGITRSFVNQADLLLTIPYGRSFPYSLGAAASTAVIVFEMLRQRSPDAAKKPL